MGKAGRRKASNVVIDNHMDDVGSASLSGSSENCSDAEASGSDHGEGPSPVFDDSAKGEAVSRKGVKRKAPSSEPGALLPQGSGSQNVRVPVSVPAGKESIKVE